MILEKLPLFNALLNSISLFLLLLGYRSIRQKNTQRHKSCMILALITSALFLASYLTYHAYYGHKVFPDLGWIKTLYLSILIPHIALAAGMLPLIVVTFYFALTKQWSRHKKIARITFPIWIFVSLSGIVIYFFLKLFYF